VFGLIKVFNSEERMFSYLLPRILVITLSLYSCLAFSQTEDSQDNSELDQVESEINKNQVFVKPQEEKSETPADVKVEKLSDLSKLQSFSEVSVLQRRFMPKSGRVQLFGGLSTGVNDPWNSSLGGNLRLAYGFTEDWGIELSYYSMNSSASLAAQNLYSEHNVNAEDFGTMTGFTGGSVMWTPIYGKMTLLNKRIVPFDMYFTLGAGSTSLSSTNSALGQKVPPSVTGITLGAGQIFAVTRSLAFRWDLSLDSFSLPTGTVNNLLLTFGASLYVPEADYR
jgi:outer membrane beta-barrel protein